MDFTLLTDARYLLPRPGNEYVSNIFWEDQLLTQALEELGFSVQRKAWDDPEMDWTTTRFAVFRTTWDYFERIDAFLEWFTRVQTQTQLCNLPSTIRWNLDKHYLLDLEKKGVRIPPTVFLEPGEAKSLAEVCLACGWEEFILKPAVSGAARHTYRFTLDSVAGFEPIFSQLIQQESMMVQQYLPSITCKGEVSMMVFGGRYSHSVLKKAKPGDFRVQDDFGGTLHAYQPGPEEIAFAEQAVLGCDFLPVYGRVDVVWDHEDRLCVSELELIEPELWMRKYPESARTFARQLAVLAETGRPSGPVPG